MTYIDDIAGEIRSHIPADQVPPASDALFRIYAVLAEAKGTAVTARDVHNAWTAWMAGQRREHPSLVPFEELAATVQAEDEVFVAAIRAVVAARGDA